MRPGLLALRTAGVAGAAAVLLAAPVFGVGAARADETVKVAVAPVGDSAPVAADHQGERRSGPGIPQAVIGLVLAGVSAVAVAFSSGRRRRAAGKDEEL